MTNAYQALKREGKLDKMSQYDSCAILQAIKQLLLYRKEQFGISTINNIFCIPQKQMSDGFIKT